jgi:hypothetical protein
MRKAAVNAAPLLAPVLLDHLGRGQWQDEEIWGTAQALPLRPYQCDALAAIAASPHRRQVLAIACGLGDIMPVDTASGTIHLCLRTQDDARRLAEAIERVTALHNKLVEQGKIAGRTIA